MVSSFKPIISLFDKVANSKDLNKKANGKLKESINATIGLFLKKDEQNIQTLSESDIFVIFESIENACSSNAIEIKTQSIDCIQKLISFKILTTEHKSIKNNDGHVLGDFLSLIHKNFCLKHNNSIYYVCLLKTFISTVIPYENQIHDICLLETVKCAYFIFMNSNEGDILSLSVLTLRQIVETIFQRLEGDITKIDTTNIPIVDNIELGKENEELKDNHVEDDIKTTCVDMNTEFTKYNNDSHEIKFPSILYKDAFLVLMSLCKLATKNLESVDNDETKNQVKSINLAVSLLTCALNSSGETFKSSEIFNQILKNHISNVLIKNGISFETVIVHAVSELFICCIKKFKVSLKTSIEKYIIDVIFASLENPSTSVEIKLIHLKTIEFMVSDSQFLVDLFINYDCGLQSDNIFEKLVTLLSKLTKKTTKQTTKFQISKATENDSRCAELLKSSLNNLVLIISCMFQWSQHLFVQMPYQIEKKSISNDNDLSVDNSVENNLTLTLHNDDPEALNALKTTKNLLQNGIKMFNIKPQKGIEYLINENVIMSSANDVATFLFNEERLDKVKIGELLGEFDDFYKNVMYSYVEKFNFKNQNFVKCLRKFLRTFRLPGESQKIDRLMEKFSSHYFAQNPNHNIFNSADVAYILAYSIIMLTTDLHNPQVKNKMQKDQYVQMNKGINNGENLPKDYLEAIYDDIHKKGIEMCGESSKLHSRNNDSFVEATRSEHALSMFMVSWSQFLVAFSIIFSETNQDDLINSVIIGLSMCLRIACIFNCEMEKNAFIQTISQFCLLNGNSIISEMSKKHVSMISHYMVLVNELCNYIGSSWKEVLKCISNLELLQSFVCSPKASIYSINSIDSADGDSSINTQWFSDELKFLTSQDILVAVDKVFLSSTRLDSKSIVKFVEALCIISAEELNFTQPKTFLLQKIIEIAYYNMNRIRIEWSNCWNFIGSHFNKVCCHEDENIATFGLDSLRQLSIKYLEKEELENFHFQREFLNPFEYIIHNSKSMAIRDLVIRCFYVFVVSHAKNIHSGWKNIYAVLSKAASDPYLPVVELSFDIIGTIFENHFGKLVSCFEWSINCLMEFIMNSPISDINMEAIRIMKMLITKIPESQEFKSRLEKECSTNEIFFQHFWNNCLKKVINCLCTIIEKSKIDVRTRSISVLFELIKIYGTSMDETCWKEFLEIIYHMLGYRRLSNSCLVDFSKISNNKTDPINEWLTTTCNHTLHALVDLYLQYQNKVHPFMFDDLCKIILWCLSKNNVQLCISSINCLDTLINSSDVTSNYEQRDATFKKFLDFFNQFIMNTHRYIVDLTKTLEKDPKIQEKYVSTIELVDLASKMCEYKRNMRKPSITFNTEENSKIPKSDYEEIESLAPILTNISTLTFSIQSFDSILFVKSDNSNPSIILDEKSCQLKSSFSFDLISQVTCCLVEYFTLVVQINFNVALRNHLLKSSSLFNSSMPFCLKSQLNIIKLFSKIIHSSFDNSVIKPQESQILSLSISKILDKILESYDHNIDCLLNESLDNISAILFDALKSIPNEQFLLVIPIIYKNVCLFVSKAKFRSQLTRDSLSHLFQRISL